MIEEILWIIIILIIILIVMKDTNDFWKMLDMSIAKMGKKDDDDRWIPASEIKTQDKIEYPEEPSYPDRTDADLIEFDLDEE